jgi:hypothetical protein
MITGLPRRGFLTGLLAAPAIIRTPGLIMPIRGARVIKTWEGLCEASRAGDPAETYHLISALGWISGTGKRYFLPSAPACANLGPRIVFDLS